MEPGENLGQDGVIVGSPSYRGEGCRGRLGGVSPDRTGMRVVLDGSLPEGVGVVQNGGVGGERRGG